MGGTWFSAYSLGGCCSGCCWFPLCARREVARMSSGLSCSLFGSPAAWSALRSGIGDPGRPACCAALSGLPKLGFVRRSCARFSALEVENKARNAKPHSTTAVVLTTSVDLNPFGPVSFFLDSPPDLLHDSTGSFRRLCRLCFHWSSILLCAAMSAHSRGQRGIVLLA